MLRVSDTDKKKLIDPLYRTKPHFWLVVFILLVLIGWGIFELVNQVSQGLGETGMQRPAYWGLYMTNFVFFIGVSLAGTLTSAILRVVGAEWRRPVTRMAEVITVCALIIASIQIIIDMGRPDRLIFVMTHGRLQSPILWDVIVVNVYLISSLFYLYVPLIPDIAILRDNMPDNAPRWRHILYRTLALGWRGNVEQWHRLEKTVSIMALFIVPVAVSVHTVTSWLLATTVQPGWHSTIFGPYFVVTAIFSGISALFVLMSLVRWIYGLEQYISLHQYRNLNYLFMAMAMVWCYFTYTEVLTLFAAQQTMEFPVLASKLWGEYAVLFWLMLVLIVGAFLIVALATVTPLRLVKQSFWSPRAVGYYTIIVCCLAFLLTDDQYIITSPLPVDVQIIGWLVAGICLINITIGVGLLLKRHLVTTSMIAGIAVIVGAWLERWNIIVPTVTHPRLIYYSTYDPSVTEIALTVGSVALFILMIIVFVKLFPVVSIWEVAEGRLVDEAEAAIDIPLPEPSESAKTKWTTRFLVHD